MSVETPLQLQKVSVSSVIADILMLCLAVKIISTLFVGKAVSVCLPRKFKKRFAQTNAGNFLLMLTFSTAFGVVVCFVSVETAFQLPKVSVSSVITNIFHVLSCCQNNFQHFLQVKRCEFVFHANSKKVCTNKRM